MTDIDQNKDRLRKSLLIGGSVVFIVIAAVFYLAGGRYVSTDDAYIQSSRVDISSNIPERVTRIDVKDNQQVRQGDTLFELDNREAIIALDDAKAKLASARLNIAALKATYRDRQAELQSAEETMSYQKREFARQQRLFAKGISSQAQLDAAQHASYEAQQTLTSVKQQLLNMRALLGGNPNIDVNSHPSVMQAKAKLDSARLNLSYTIIKAPIDGIVAKVEELQDGDYIKAATPVFSLMSSNTVWVEANFKETEITHMRPGLEATIEIDAYPGHPFHGKVESFSPGTGSSFSLLPPENATGNWVKVVQRLPVRISIDDLDPSRPLHSGLSAVVKVDTHYSRLKSLW